MSETLKALTVHAVRQVRISGDPDDVAFWQNHYEECPRVLLDGVSVDHVCEAFSDDDGTGYVTVILHEPDGRVKLAKVIADDGEILNTIIARKTFRGNVQILGRRYR